MIKASYLRTVRACDLPVQLREVIECWIENWNEEAIWHDLEHECQERSIRTGVLEEVQTITGITHPEYEQSVLALKEVEREIAVAEQDAVRLATSIPLDHANEALQWLRCTAHGASTPRIDPNIKEILVQLNLYCSGAVQIAIDCLSQRILALNG